MRNIIGLILLLLVSCTAYTQSTVDRNKVIEYLQDQQYEEAIAYLRPAINDKDAREVALLAYTFYLSGKIAEAADNYEKVLQLDSNHIPAHQYLASIRMQQNEYQPALVHYQRIVQLRPQNAAAWKQLSFAAFTAQQSDSGFAWLNKTYALNPADPKVVSRLAEEWLERKNFALADSLVKVYLAVDSLQKDVLMTAARTSFFKKEYPRTMAIGEQLKAQGVASPNTFIYIVAACYTLKKYTDCISFYEYLLLSNTASESITYYTALAYTALKKYTESNELLHICIDLAKSSSLENYYSSASVNYENLQQFKPAVACLDTAYYLSHRPIRQYSIGRIYETGYKNEAAAMKYYKRYMRLYKPGSPEEKDIYQYLKTRVKK
ncbi:tetratricopeptide repeat protein [Chitinophaga sp. MM2321]|uniref:tetratricopeptide repeat protein n=1 Tax=Chitinophaga sp. MM2321 TaxID=3137178 RepID=UPI0032D5AE9E